MNANKFITSIKLHNEVTFEKMIRKIPSNKIKVFNKKFMNDINLRYHSSQSSLIVPQGFLQRWEDLVFVDLDFIVFDSMIYNKLFVQQLIRWAVKNGITEILLWYSGKKLFSAKGWGEPIDFEELLIMIFDNGFLTFSYQKYLLLEHVISKGHIKLLKYLLEQGTRSFGFEYFIINQRLIDIAATKGRLIMLNFCLEYIRCNYIPSSFEEIESSQETSCNQWDSIPYFPQYRHKFYPYDRDPSDLVSPSQYTVNIAVRKGHLDMVKYLVKVFSLIPDHKYLKVAAKRGFIEILKFVSNFKHFSDDMMQDYCNIAPSIGIFNILCKWNKMRYFVNGITKHHIPVIQRELM
ncbi:MAG: hypothetical protein JKX76_01875 [Colwellia sp.]|nr:hypothetical protein [Colwellia sp.]